MRKKKRPYNTGRPPSLTLAQKRKAWKLKREGKLSVRAIAEAVGVGEHTMKHYIYDNMRELIRPGAVGRLRVRPLTREQQELALLMRESGESWVDITEILEINHLRVPEVQDFVLKVRPELRDINTIVPISWDLSWLFDEGYKRTKEELKWQRNRMKSTQGSSQTGQ